MFGIAVGVTALVVVLTLAARKIPIQYPKQIRGRRMTQATKSYLPLRVNTAGVIPIIFAQAVIMLPATLTMAIRNEVFNNAISKSILLPWNASEIWFRSRAPIPSQSHVNLSACTLIA